MQKPKVIVITGPTASGKTKLSVELAKRINGEIISADSMQIYRNLNVGTAKVTKEEMQGIIHYGIDICEVDEKFSVADFQKYAYEKIEKILNQNKFPIIVGGTGLYIDALIKNMIFTECDINYEYRKELEKIATEKGKDYLYDILLNLDAEAAKNIHPNNIKRIIRAIEICNLGNTTKTKQNLMTNKDNGKYNYYTFVIDMDREKLYNRINERVDLMMNSHILQEAKWLLSRNLSGDCTAMQAIGYKELFPYLRGKESLDTCVQKLKQESRRYAKRQLTWFNKMDDVKKLDFDKGISFMIEEILKGVFNE